MFCGIKHRCNVLIIMYFCLYFDVKKKRKCRNWKEERDWKDKSNVKSNHFLIIRLSVPFCVVILFLLFSLNFLYPKLPNKERNSNCWSKKRKERNSNYSNILLQNKNKWEKNKVSFCSCASEHTRWIYIEK